MPLPTGTKNNLLNGQAFDAMSLHSGFPGVTGANELFGGGYARQAVVINPPSGGQRLLNAGVSWSVPICVVSWLGLWNAGVFLWPIPNGGATPKNFIALATTDTFYAPGHAYPDGQKIAFFGVPPTGITEGTTAFIRDSTTDTFKVSATLGGSAIDITGNASAGCWVVAITEDNYAAPGTHSLTAGSITIPD
jgi:hypothetical protein